MSNISSNIKTCKVCNMQFHNFLPLKGFRETLINQGYKYKVEDFETLNIDELFCPACNSTDRERIVANLLRENYITKSTLENPIRILDLSPPLVLSLYLRYHPNILYESASPDETNKVDFQNTNFTKLPLESNTYDIVLCLHVLENEEDDNAVLKEIFRVLKPGGKVIAVSPININIPKTINAADIPTNKEAYLMFNKNKRLYAKDDFMNLIKLNGFVLQQYKIKNYNQMGLSSTSTIYEGLK